MSSRTWVFMPGFVVAVAFGISIGKGSNSNSRQPADIKDEMMERYGRGDGETLSSLESWLKLMPASERDAWMSYFRDVSKIHSGANESIERANWSKTEQPCFSDLAARFYGEILKEDQRRYAASLKGEHGKSRPLEGRISLNERAGAGEWADLAPGSVWKKALEISRGSPNLAMALIGLCGHDDAISFKPQLRPGRAATESYVEIKRQFIAEVGSLLPPEGRENLEDLLKDEERDRLLCLSYSSLILPGALGAETDLRPEFKDEIIQKQAPNLGGDALPAKYYHVIASAMRTCELTAQAYTSFLSIVSSPLLAKLYRAYVIARMIANPGSAIQMESIQPDDITDKEIKSLFIRYTKLGPAPHDGAMDERRTKFYLDQKNWLAFLVKSSLEKKDPTLARGEIETAYAKRDAGLIAQRDFRKFSLPILGEIYLPPRRKTPRRDCADLGWPQKRCDRALAKLESWEVDFDWSASQHYLGALFAFQNCRKLATGETLETLACRASINK